jgi:cytidylate kinase
MLDRTEFIKTCFGDRLDQDKHRSGYPFVTISRQAGAGGHSLGEALLRQTEQRHYADVFSGWKLFDRELCEAVVREPDIDIPIETLLREEYHSGFREFLSDMKGEHTSQMAVYKRVLQMIRVLANVGKTIIVGRASNFVTRDLPAGIHVRLVAPEELRVERIRRLLDLDEEGARQQVRIYDKERARFVRDYYSADVDAEDAYDVIWDTSKADVEDLASDLVDQIAAREQTLRPA